MKTQNEIRLESLKQIAYDSWVIFRHMNPENESFKDYIDLIDAYLGKMYHDFQFTPEWISAYHIQRMNYWNPMKIKTGKIEPANNDAYFAFKHKNLLLEIILN
jgi:hypothetical protein